MTFRLVVPDLHVDASHVQAQGGAPDLPALRALLAGATSNRRDSGWRAGLLREMRVDADPLAPATVAAWGLASAAAGASVALAQPVHQIAGMSRVHLHPAGVVQLDAAEQTLLCESFDRELGANGTRLRHVGGGLLLEGDFRPAAGDESQEPSRFRGSELSPAGDRLPPELRRLGAEVEMWLYEHPLNRTRQGLGLLPVNALWFWGAGVVTDRVTPPADAAAPVAYGEDPFLVGLWTALRGALQPPASAFAQVRETSAVVVTRAEAGSEVDALVQLESQWFAPLLDAVESRRIADVRLWIGARTWQIRRRGFPRRLRRPAPWWESFAP